MNKEQAKRLLLACRPGSIDEKDPEIAQALEVAEKDPSLRQWLDQQAAFHGQLRSAIRRMPVPPNLRERILAQPKIITPIWRRPEWALLAACLTLALVLVGLWIGPKSRERSFATFRSRMVGSALRVYPMDIVSSDLAQVRQFLGARGAPTDYTLSSGLQTTPVKGGARLYWQGYPVAMVCFALPKEQMLYLFVLQEKAIPRWQRPGKSPALAEVGGIMTASWRQNGKVYLMATADSAMLQQMLRAKIEMEDVRNWPPSIVAILIGASPAD